MDYNSINIEDEEIWNIFKDYAKIKSYMPSYFKESKLQYLQPKSNILNRVSYLIKHIAYMVYYPKTTEKIINKYQNLFQFYKIQNIVRIDLENKSIIFLLIQKV